MDKKFILIPIALFIISNFLGLFAATQLLTTDVVEESIVVSQNPVSALYFLGVLMLATAIILVLYRFRLNILVKIVRMYNKLLTTILNLEKSFFNLECLITKKIFFYKI